MLAWSRPGERLRETPADRHCRPLRTASPDLEAAQNRGLGLPVALHQHQAPALVCVDQRRTGIAAPGSEEETQRRGLSKASGRAIRFEVTEQSPGRRSRGPPPKKSTRVCPRRPMRRQLRRRHRRRLCNSTSAPSRVEHRKRQDLETKASETAARTTSTRSSAANAEEDLGVQAVVESVFRCGQQGALGRAGRARGVHQHHRVRRATPDGCRWRAGLRTVPLRTRPDCRRRRAADGAASRRRRRLERPARLRRSRASSATRRAIVEQEAHLPCRQSGVDRQRDGSDAGSSEHRLEHRAAVAEQQGDAVARLGPVGAQPAREPRDSRLEGPRSRGGARHPRRPAGLRSALPSAQSSPRRCAASTSRSWIPEPEPPSPAPDELAGGGLCKASEARSRGVAERRRRPISLAGGGLSQGKRSAQRGVARTQATSGSLAGEDSSKASEARRVRRSRTQATSGSLAGGGLSKASEARRRGVAERRRRPAASAGGGLSKGGLPSGKRRHPMNLKGEPCVRGPTLRRRTRYRRHQGAGRLLCRGARRSQPAVRIVTRRPWSTTPSAIKLRRRLVPEEPVRKPARDNRSGSCSRRFPRSHRRCSTRSTIIDRYGQAWAQLRSERDRRRATVDDGRLLVRGRTHQSFLPPKDEVESAGEDAFVVDENTDERRSQSRARPAFPTQPRAPTCEFGEQDDRRAALLDVLGTPASNYHTDAETRRSKLGFPAHRLSRA